jgi:hypothetical protein
MCITDIVYSLGYQRTEWPSTAAPLSGVPRGYRTNPAVATGSW